MKFDVSSSLPFPALPLPLQPFPPPSLLPFLLHRHSFAPWPQFLRSSEAVQPCVRPSGNALPFLLFVPVSLVSWTVLPSSRFPFLLSQGFCRCSRSILHRSTCRRRRRLRARVAHLPVFRTFHYRFCCRPPITLSPRSYCSLLCRCCHFHCSY